MGFNQGFSSFAVPDLAAAKTFYGDTLGLEVREQEGWLELMLPGGARVMVYPKEDHRPAVFTVLNFAVDDVHAAVDEYSAKGLEWQRYEGFQHDDKGVVSDPEFGPDIAWTTDPAGNIIAFMQLEGL
jgi:catechol 2,3-dioxygenase-like lactoylglutathione lyase family enzyme